MQKRQYEIWLSQGRQLLHTLRFSALDAETRTCVNRECFYFNHSRCFIIAWAIIALELLNIVNVLLLSPSGLATRNNRQYFAMYVLLLLSAVACLAVRRLLKHRIELLGRYYVTFAAFWVAWHAVLSTMDLQRNPSITVFITGIFALSLLIRLKSAQAITILPAGFLLLLCAGDKITGGIGLNAFIVTLVAVLSSCSRYVSTLEELGYRKKMVLQEGRRAQERQLIQKLAQQQAALLRHSREAVGA